MKERQSYTDRGTSAWSASKRYFHRIASAREFVLLAGLFVVVVTGLVLVTVGGVEVLSSVRVYTNAEALYSKGQKDAVYYLHQYALSGNEKHFRKYEAAIAVPLGYRQARAELDKANPDPEVIRQGRPHLYDTHETSGLGHLSCASCHVDARMDRLAWDLGAPDGAPDLLAEASRQLSQFSNQVGLVLAPAIQRVVIDRWCCGSGA